MFKTLPHLPRGVTTLCNNDVVLVSTFNPNVINELDITYAEGVSFYQDVCSEMRPFRQITATTRQLNITENEKGSIDELYLPRGSSVAYNFTLSISNSNSTLFCAKIHIFLCLQDYLEFLREGEFSPPAESVFLSQNGQTNYTIS